MGDFAELIAVIGMGAFYAVSFVATAALVELGYVITQRVQNRKRIREWLRKR